jgi:large-conductance mechanosensitive channel
VVCSHGQQLYFAVGVAVGAAFGRVASAVLTSAVVVVLVGVAGLVEDTSDFVACVRAAFVGSAYQLEVELKFDSEAE